MKFSQRIDRQRAAAENPKVLEKHFSTGALVYVVCGYRGCAQRLEVDAAVWEAELTRRLAHTAGVQVWQARGDRLVPVAPDADGRVPTPDGRRP